MVERMKGVKCLACHWEDGGFGIILRRKDEGWSLTCRMRRRSWGGGVLLWGGGIVCCAEGDETMQESKVLFILVK